MNAPFQVAQLTTGQSSAAQPKTISLTKPGEGQSVMVKIEGPVKLDFTAIASEKITLVHGVAPVAERLTILFDNKSIIIVDPFWDSSGKPLHLVSGIELEPGRVVSAEEFATLFPMTDNQDVLAGAGTGGAPVKSSGGEFAGPHVDGLPDFVRLPLLGPEELGNWKSEIPTNLAQENPAANEPDSIPTFGESVSGIVEEEHSVRASKGEGNEDTEDASGNDTDPSPEITQTIGGVAGNLNGLVVGGNQPITFSVNTPALLSAVTYPDGGTKDLFSQGEAVQWIGINTSIPGEVTLTAGVPGDGESVEDRVVFTLVINTATHTYTFTLFDQLDHPDIGEGAGSEETLVFDFTSLLHIEDNNGDVLTLPPGAFTVGVIDDTPIAEQLLTPAKALSVDEDDLDNFDATHNLDGDDIEGSDGTDQSGSTSASFDLDSLIGTVVKIGFDEFKDTDESDQINVHAEFQLKADQTLLEGLNLSSKNVDIDGVTLDDTTTPGIQVLTFTADGRIVFTLTLDTATSELTYELIDQLDHPLQDNPATLDEEEAFEDSLTFDLSGFVQVTDFDKDPATLADNTLTITVVDDIPVITASDVCVDGELTYTAIKAGNVDERGLNGAGDRDVLLSSPDGTVNTTGTDIGIANQQIASTETVRIDFVNSVTFDPVTDYNGHYMVDSASFTIAQIQGNPDSTATVFVQVFDANDNLNFADDGSPLAIANTDVTVTGDSDGIFTIHAVYDAGVQIGVVIEGLDDGATVTVNTTGSNPEPGHDFDRLIISNYDGVTFESDAIGTETTLSGSAFSVGGLQSLACTPITLSVTHDESDGFTPQSGPNPENDVDPDTAPTSLTDAITEAGISAVLGYAKSGGTVTDLFSVNFGADEPGNVSYQLSTFTAGEKFTGQDSGLNATDGDADILLYTDATNPNIVWGVTGADFETGTKVFALHIDDAGHLWIAQFAAIAHDEDGSTEAAFDDIASITSGLIFVTAVASDADGDTVYAVSGAGLEINFQDDGPHATAEDSQNVGEGNTITGQFDFDGGTDGAAVTHINDTLLVFNPLDDNYSQPVDIGDGSIKVKADGSYSFTADNPGSGTVSATFTVTDGDGDTVTEDFSFEITDVNVPTGGTAAAAVDDDGLVGPPAGNPASVTNDIDANTGDDAGDTSEATFTGTLGGSVGLDTPGTFSFAALAGTTGSVGTETVLYSWAANVLTATVNAGARSGTELFTVAVTNPATGAYTVTLKDNVLHAGGPNNENPTDPTTDLAYVITDSDGSTANGTLTITFDDDAPTATDEASQDVGEGTTKTGTLDFVQGADGATVTHIGTTLLIFNPADSNYSQAIDIGDGSIKVKADGSYSFTADNPVNGVGSASATFTVTDGDGDTVTKNVTFAITDVNTPTGGTASAAVDDDGLVGPPAGNPASTTNDINADTGDSGAGIGNEAVFVGTLGGSVGLDTPGTFSFAALDSTTGSVGTETVLYSWAANVLTATVNAGARSGTELFTVAVTNPATGAYTVTLKDNVLHAGGPNNENPTDPTTDLAYVITDSDGSTANGTLTITFDDDAPTAVNDDSQSVAETAAGTIGGNVISPDLADDADLSGKDALGADGGGLTHVKLPGSVDFVDITTGNNEGGGVYSFAVSGVGTYTFQADGTWTLDPVLNASTSDQSGTFQYRITDGDGDTSEATQPITVTNTSFPLAQTGSIVGKVEEEHLASGQATGNEDTTASPDEDDDTNANFNLTTAITTGNLSLLISGGLDGTATYGFAASIDGTNVTFVGGGNVQSQTQNVIYDVQGNTLWGFVNGGGVSTDIDDPADRAVFRIDLNTTTGVFTFTLLDNIDHHLPAGADNVEGIKSIDLGGKFTVTDSLEPETMTFDNVSVKVIDDIPTVIFPDHAVVANGNSDPLTLDLDLDDLIGNNYGADGAGTVRFPDSLNTAESHLTSNGAPITYAVSGGGLILTASANGNTVFTVTLDPTTGGHYTIDMNGTVDSTSQVDFFGADYAFSGGNTGWVGLLQMSGNQDVLLTPFGTDGDTINGSAVAVGVGGGNKISAGEGMRLDFVTNLSGDPGPSSKGYHDTPPTYQDHVFDNHYTTNGASLTFGAGHANSTVQITARDDADAGGNDVINDGAFDSVTSITIKYGALTQVVTFAGPPNGIGTTATPFIIGDRTYTVQFVDVDPSGTHYVVKVTGILDESVSIATFTADGYNSLDVENLAGDEFNITGFGGAVPTTNPSNFELPIQLVDGDGDAVNSSIAITVVSASQGVQDHSNDLVGDPHTYTATALNQNIIGSDFNDTLNGDAGNLANVLSGGAGNDTINGLGGNDFLFGGAGNDTLDGGDGNDRLDGETGNDTASYATAGAGVTVSLAVATAQNTGGAGSDTLVSIENLTGSNSGDTLTGDANDNILQGLGGNDILIGGDGADVFIGGAGNDTITISTTADDNVQDIVRYNALTEFGDGTITAFDSNGSLATDDRIEFGGALNAELDDIVDDDDFAWATGNGVNGGATAVNLNTTSEAIFLAGTNGEGLTNANLKSAAALVTELTSEFAITANVGQDALIVVNATDANAFSVWRYVEGGTAGVQAGELSLVGSFSSDAAVKTGNLDLTN